MSASMTWEQKLAALKALGETSLKMRKPGDWYVEQIGVEVKEVDGNGVIGGRHGDGRTPEEAVNNHWIELTEREPLAYVRIKHLGERQHVKWNGFMWADVSVLYPTQLTPAKREFKV